jgi:ABC-type multidrug transport system ATPase subunit
VTAVLTAHELTKQFGDRSVLEAVSLRIEAGRMIAVVGRSGSGKTTLLSLLARFMQPDSGTLTGVSETWREMAVVPQTLGLLDELTALENTTAPLRLHDVPQHEAEATGDAVLGELGLHELTDRFVGEMSAGQRQRVAIARALVGDPLLLLADEPTSHLDEAARGLVTTAIACRVAEGMAAVLVTHDPHVRDAAHVVLELGS